MYVRVEYLAQERNVVSPARTRAGPLDLKTRALTAPPTRFQVNINYNI